MMTAKGFLTKANGKVSALAFLQEHRAWLLTGTRKLLTEPILIQLDRGELFPTPALNEIKVAVMNHMIATDILAGQSKMSEASEPDTVKACVVTICIGDNPVMVTTKVKTKEGEKEVSKPMSMGFDSYYKAEEWACRRLQEGGPGWIAKMQDNVLGKSKELTRDQAFGRLVKIKPVPTMRVNSSKGDKRLSGKPKVKGGKYYYPT